MRVPSSRFRPLFGVLAVGLLVACVESPTASAPDVSFAKGGKPGANAPEATVILPAPDGSDGLFADGNEYTIPFGADGMSLKVDCSRPFVLQRPAGWDVADGDEIHCRGRDGFSRLDLNDMGTCSNLFSGCDVGTGGHDPSQGTNFSPDLNYYFRVETGPGKSGFTAYDVVWVDGHATVEGTEDADGDGVPEGITACRWHLTATMAEFWDESDLGSHEGPSPMALDVTVTRQDLECP